MPQTLLFQPTQSSNLGARSAASTVSARMSAKLNVDQSEFRQSDFRQSLDRATNRETVADEQPAKSESSPAPAKAADNRSKTAKQKKSGSVGDHDQHVDRDDEDAPHAKKVSAKSGSADKQTDSDDQAAAQTGHAKPDKKPEEPSEADAQTLVASEQAAGQQTAGAAVHQPTHGGDQDDDSSDAATTIETGAAGAAKGVNASTELQRGAASAASTRASVKADQSDSPESADEPEAAQKGTSRASAGSKLKAAKPVAKQALEDDSSISPEIAGKSGAAESIDAVPNIFAAADFAEALSNAGDASSAKDDAPVDDDPTNATGATPPAPERPGDRTVRAHVTQTKDDSADGSAGTAESRFAAANHDKVVTGVKAELLPNGGTMKLRLDPPELGTMQVSLHMRDGIVSASFQTNNDEATRLLSHSLSDLRSTLEANGIVVDKLQVQQAPKNETGRDAAGRDTGAKPGQTPGQDPSSQRDQQRKDMVQRLWDKLAGNDPLDMVA